MKLKGPKTEVIDLKGRALLPGFVDAHGHMTGGGLQALSANLLAPPDGNVKDIATLQQTLRDWIAANDAAVKKVNLIVGFGYDNATLAETAPPDARRPRRGLERRPDPPRPPVRAPRRRQLEGARDRRHHGRDAGSRRAA